MCDLHGVALVKCEDPSYQVGDRIGVLAMLGHTGAYLRCPSSVLTQLKMSALMHMNRYVACGDLIPELSY